MDGDDILTGTAILLHSKRSHTLFGDSGTFAPPAGLVTRRPDLAVADCRQLIDVWRAHPCNPAPEIASAQALLATACLA